MHEFVVRPERMRSTGCDLSVPFEASLPPTARVLFPKKKHPTHVRGEDLCLIVLVQVAANLPLSGNGIRAPYGGAPHAKFLLNSC